MRAVPRLAEELTKRKRLNLQSAETGDGVVELNNQLDYQIAKRWFLSEDCLTGILMLTAEATSSSTSLSALRLYFLVTYSGAVTTMRAIRAPLSSIVSQIPIHDCSETYSGVMPLRSPMPKTPGNMRLDVGHNLGTTVMLTSVNVGCSSLESGVSIGDSTAGVVVEVCFYLVLVKKG